MFCNRTAQLCHVAVLALALCAGPRPGPAQDNGLPQPTLVRVNIVSETRFTGEFEVYGQRIPDYQPRIIQVFPSTGAVIDDKGHVLTFLGYRWVDIQSADPRVDIITSDGQKYPAKLVGIDESIGTAVVVAANCKLPLTPICRQCDIREGASVVVPSGEGPNFAGLRGARVLSVTDLSRESGTGRYMLTFNRVPGVGEPILNTDYDLLGFVASQQPPTGRPFGGRTVFYPISQLLSSAEKILRAGGHISTGWLGVFLERESERGSAGGVVVKAIQESSPALKAGIAPDDTIVKWAGTPVQDERQFIRLVQETPIGSTVEMEILRRGKPLTLSALIEARKPQEAADRLALNFPRMIPFTATEPVEAPFLGISAVPLSPQLAEAMQMPGQSGLLVLAVAPPAPFARAGLAEGDVITSVDGQPVHDMQRLLEAVRAPHRGRALQLKVVRKGAERTLLVK